MTGGRGGGLIPQRVDVILRHRSSTIPWCKNGLALTARGASRRCETTTRYQIDGARKKSNPLRVKLVRIKRRQFYLRSKNKYAKEKTKETDTGSFQFPFERLRPSRRLHFRLLRLLRRLHPQKWRRSKRVHRCRPYRPRLRRIQLEVYNARFSRRILDTKISSTLPSTPRY